MTVTREPLVPGVQSPRRSVPAHIARPEYVDRPAPERFVGSEIKDQETIERMRLAGRIALVTGTEGEGLPAEVLARFRNARIP